MYSEPASVVESTGRAHSRKRLSQPRTKHTCKQKIKAATCIYIYIYLPISITISVSIYEARPLGKPRVHLSPRRSIPSCRRRNGLTCVFVCVCVCVCVYIYIYMYTRSIGAPTAEFFRSQLRWWSRRGVPIHGTVCHSPGRNKPIYRKIMSQLVYIYIKICIYIYI